MDDQQVADAQEAVPCFVAKVVIATILRAKARVSGVAELAVGVSKPAELRQRPTAVGAESILGATVLATVLLRSCPPESLSQSQAGRAVPLTALSQD